MTLLALLLTRDPEVVRVVERLLRDLGIGVLTTDELDEAAELLERRKFDGLIVDCEGLPGSRALVHGLRRSRSNRTVVVFALASRTVSMRELFDLGANFALEKPLTETAALRCLRAARPLLVRERRRYFRCRLETPVAIETGGRARSFSSLNLSEGGIALRATQGLPVGATVKVNFSLPDAAPAISARGEVVWVDSDGRAGLRLAEMSDSHRLLLCDWLARGLEQVDNIPAGSEPGERVTLSAS
jgi:CheY-like chemotaxis protein